MTKFISSNCFSKVIFIKASVVFCLQDRSIRHKNTGQCLQKPDHSDTAKPLLRPCDNSVGQQWVMDSKFKWQANKAWGCDTEQNKNTLNTNWKQYDIRVFRRHQTDINTRQRGFYDHISGCGATYLSSLSQFHLKVIFSDGSDSAFTNYCCSNRTSSHTSNWNCSLRTWIYHTLKRVLVSFAIEPGILSIENRL